MLEIKNLHVAVDGKEILKGLTLSIQPGEVHAIMGPNGSGKSTLAYVLAGRAGYDITEGSIRYNGEDLAALAPEERAAKGVFLAMQYPVEIPGVTTMTFLKTALNAQRRQRGEPDLDAVAVLKLVRAKAKTLNVSEEMLKRALNVGFSGGEKKRLEILQMALFEPKLAILDETDSGLDIDALRLVAEGVNSLRDPVARHAGDHPLSAPAGLHRARPHSCAGQGPHCGGRRQGTGAGAGSQGLRADREGRRHDAGAEPGSQGEAAAAGACAWAAPPPDRGMEIFRPQGGAGRSKGLGAVMAEWLVGNLPGGVEMFDLRWPDPPAWVMAHIAHANRNVMSAASLALSAGGVAFRVPKDAAITDPLKLDFTGPGHVRALLVLEDGASLTLLEGVGAADFRNVGFEIVLGAGASLEHVRICARCG